MMCPTCGRADGWHAIGCAAFPSVTLGLGTFRRYGPTTQTLSLDESELIDCAAEGIATIGREPSSLSPPIR